MIQALGKRPVSAVTLLFLSLLQHCSHPLSTRDGRARPTAWGGQEGLEWGALGEFGLEIRPRAALTHPSMALSPPCCCHPKRRWPEPPCPWINRYDEESSLIVGIKRGEPLLFWDPKLAPHIIPFFWSFLLPIPYPSPLYFNSGEADSLRQSKISGKRRWLG